MPEARICVITGASSGIGEAAAYELASRGSALVLSGRNEKRLNLVAELCRRDGVAVETVIGDVGDSATATRLYQAAQALADKLKGDSRPPNISAVFAAGIFKFVPTEECTDEDWRQVLDSNLNGLFYCCREAAKFMLANGGGRVVNVLSIASKHPLKNAIAYASAKAGAYGLTTSFCREYRDRGIQFTAFMPGSVLTPLWNEQSWQPNQADMLKPKETAAAIVNVLYSPMSVCYDEITFMPPKGIL